MENILISKYVIETWGNDLEDLKALRNREKLLLCLLNYIMIRKWKYQLMSKNYGLKYLYINFTIRKYAVYE